MSAVPGLNAGPPGGWGGGAAGWVWATNWLAATLPAETWGGWAATATLGVTATPAAAAATVGYAVGGGGATPALYTPAPVVAWLWAAYPKKLLAAMVLVWWYSFKTRKKKKQNQCIKTQHKFDSQQTVSHFDLTKFMGYFFLDFFFQNFRRHKHSTDVGIRNWRKTRKKKVKKLSSLFAFGFSSFLYSVIKFMKLNLVKFHEKRTDCCQAMIKISSKEWISLRLHFFFHQIDFWMMNWITCALQSDFSKFEFCQKYIGQKKPRSLELVAKMSTLIYEMEIHKVSRSKI